MTNQNAPLSAPEIDAHLDAILRASGSALRNYSLPGYLESMRAAVRAVASDAVSKLHAPVARPPVCAPTWEEVKEANSVLASYSWNSNGEGGGVTTTERKLAAALLRVAGVDWNPNGDPVYALRAPVADERVPHHDQPHQTGVGEWCAPGPAAEQRRTWMLRFADTERGDCIYYDEQEARRAFAQAEGRGWNCYLFEFARRAALAGAPVFDTLPLENALHELVSKIAPGLDTGDILQDARQASAMLGVIMASAPVAAPSDETLRLASVIADKIEDGTLFQSGIFSRRELADKVRSVVRIARQSTPVAQQAALSAQSATKDDKAALGIPECGKPLCAPGEHHPLCRHGWAEKKAASAPVADPLAAFEAWSKNTNQGYDLTRMNSGKLATYESDLTEHAWRGYCHAALASAPMIGFRWSADDLLASEAAQVRRDTLLSVLGALNSNPYNLTKSECVDLVRELFHKADSAQPAPNQSDGGAVYG